MPRIKGITQTLNKAQSKDNRCVAAHGYPGISLFDAVQRCSRYTRTLRKRRR